MSEWVIIGVPTSAGAHHAGQDLAPDALRAAGLTERLTRAGLTVTDAGNVPGAVFAADRANPAARNVEVLARVAGEVASAIAAAMGIGALPLVLGGDCTITLGAVAGMQRQYPTPAWSTWTATPMSACRATVQASWTRWASRTFLAGERQS